MGYHRAGFEVTGVDSVPQKNYPFEFIQGDALTTPLSGYDVIHASPPCQAYTKATKYLQNKGKKYPDLVAKTRARLIESNCHYVIENVPGAPLINPIQLCGTSFGLGSGVMELQRHRLFESDIFILTPECQHTDKLTIGVYGNGTPSWQRHKLGRCVLVDEWREAMGIDWMLRKELRQAIPPAYTEWIGKQLIEVLETEAVECHLTRKGGT